MPDLPETKKERNLLFPSKSCLHSNFEFELNNSFSYFIFIRILLVCCHYYTRHGGTAVKIVFAVIDGRENVVKLVCPSVGLKVIGRVRGSRKPRPLSIADFRLLRTHVVLVQASVSSLHHE